MFPSIRPLLRAARRSINRCISPLGVEIVRKAGPVRGEQLLAEADGRMEKVGEFQDWQSTDSADFLLQRASQCGTPTTQALITSLRAFLRFLNFCGKFRDDLALAIPAVAHWRLARLPHCLSAEEVDRLIAACNGTDPRRLRDRLIGEIELDDTWRHSSTFC